PSARLVGHDSDRNVTIGIVIHGFLNAPMVKWTSYLASNETLRVRLLLGVLNLVPSSRGQDVPLTWERAVVRVHPGSLSRESGVRNLKKNGCLTPELMVAVV